MTNAGSTVELANMAPQLRGDLAFKLQKHGDMPCYLIEDEKNAKFYRVGIPEYAFISLLDGTTTVREALALTAAQLGSEALTENDAGTICKWLIDSQLAQTSASMTTERLVESSDKSRRRKQAQWLNPLIVRLPLIRPDPFIGRLRNVLGWWISWPAFAVWMMTILLAARQLVTHHGGLTPSDSPILAPGNWLGLAIAWCGLKLVHELSHGLACKVFGGEVREAGIVMITFAPVPYVDVTSSWRFRSKWKRMMVAAAGMYSELFVAAIAAIAWTHLSPGFAREQARNLMVTGSLVTLLFNANPLMRFDGYYLLSDLINIPNLYGLGQQFTRYWGRRYVMGIRRDKFPHMSIGKAITVRAYGWLALLWRVMISAGMVITAATLFHGVGIVLSIIGAVAWFGLPTWRFLRRLLGPDQRDHPDWRQFAFVGGSIAAAMVAILLLPEPGGVRATGVVAYEPLHLIRAPHAGFIAAIQVPSGGTVVPNQPIVRIENPELQVEVADLRLERQQSEFRCRQFRDSLDVAASQVEAQMRAAITERLSERHAQLANSIVRAPAAGHVIDRNIDALVGRYVHEGETIFAIGNESDKQIEISVAQDDLKTFASFRGRIVQANLARQASVKWECTLQSLDPTASRMVLHNALAAPHGGPLAVQPASETTEESGPRWELVTPRFQGTVTLTSSQSEKLRAGQLATIRLDASRGTLASFLYRRVAQWIETRLGSQLN